MSAASTRGRGPRPRGAGVSGSRGTSRGGSSVTIRGPPTTTTRTASTSGTSTPTTTASTGIVGHKDKSGRITEYTSPEDQCPQCKTDRFLNPKLKLLVSPCYHKLCTSCIDRIWALGPAPCPECGNVCRKSQFGAQTFQDLGVEREVDVRKRMQRVFVKTSTDFTTLKEFNDYLEEVEQLTFNLINGIDLAETNARIATYESRLTAKSSTVAANNTSASDVQSAIDAHLTQSKKSRLDRYKAYALADRQLKTTEERAIVEALENGAEDEDIQRVQEEYTRKREDLERQRTAEEDRIMVVEEEQRRAIASGPSSGTKATAQQLPTTIQWESLQLFTGPLATLSDGSELLPHLADLRPPSPLQTALASKSSASTYPLYDPWTSKTYTDQMDRDEKLKLNASGWDAAMPWAWESRVAVQSLCVRPRDS